MSLFQILKKFKNLLYYEYKSELNTALRTLFRPVMELPWRKAKCRFMMTKRCPRVEECERRVKRSAASERHASPLCVSASSAQYIKVIN